MELRHLRYFVTLAEELHFGRAALRLGISQPPLSQQIRHLEEELSAKLFERDNRNVALTQTGALFLEEARATLEQAERARRVATRAEQGELGEVTVGLFPSAPLIEPVARLIIGFRRTHAKVRLTLRERPTQTALHDLAEGNLSVAFLRYASRPPVPPNFIVREIMREPLAVLLRQDHRLARSGRPIALAALAEEPFIHFSPSGDNALYPQFAALCREAGFEPCIEQEANQNGMILALVAAGLGISILPQSLCRAQLPETCVRPLKGDARSMVWFAYSRKMQSGPTAAFVAMALGSEAPQLPR